MAQLTYKYITEEVKNAISYRAVKEHIKYLSSKNINLWGAKKGRYFLFQNYYIAIFKLLNNLGYCYLAKITKPWLHLSDCSLRHNIKIIINILGQWGKSQLLLGTKKDWNKTSKEIKMQKYTKGSNLLMDSVDIRLWGKQSTSKKNSTWSYKCNAPGRRYQVLTDMQPKILKIWHGYSPKIYDGWWLESKKEWLENHLKGGIVLADCHYMWGVDNLSSVEFRVPIEKRKNRKRKFHEIEINSNEILTKVKQTYNNQIRNIRARVEQPFGLIKLKWKILQDCWKEDVSLLDDFIFFVFGLYNFSLK